MSVDIYFYNTLTRQKEKFTPIDPNLVRMYTCGPTVYRDVHLGNFRTYIMADLVRRVLSYNGYRVKKIQNITDVGHMRRNEDNPEVFDPVIKAALESGKTPLEITQTYTRQFWEDSRRLNIIDADVYPKASEHIEEIIFMVEELMKKGYAYDTGENIYFNVGKHLSYGKLSGNTLEKMDKLLEAVRVASETDKSDSADFVLWKRVSPDYLMKWDSPWGLGSPGWHIECSAMSIKYLGKHFDIHTGGEDNIFPHHEDEIAQSEAFSGGKFVNHWLHGGHLTVNGEKMARRRGNVYLVTDLISKGFNPLAFRYLTFNSYYRSKMNFTWEALSAVQRALDKLYDLFGLGRPSDQDPTHGVERDNHGLPGAVSVNPVSLSAERLIGCAEFEERFLAAVNDDLDLPKALSVVWELVKSTYPPSAKKASLLKFDSVLGLGFSRIATATLTISQEIQRLVTQREEARQLGDFVRADELRRQIGEAGFQIDDTPDGSKVKKGV